MNSLLSVSFIYGSDSLKFSKVIEIDEIRGITKSRQVLSNNGPIVYTIHFFYFSWIVVDDMEWQKTPIVVSNAYCIWFPWHPTHKDAEGRTNIKHIK